MIAASQERLPSRSHVSPSRDRHVFLRRKNATSHTCMTKLLQNSQQEAIPFADSTFIYEDRRPTCRSFSVPGVRRSQRRSNVCVLAVVRTFWWKYLVDPSTFDTFPLNCCFLPRPVDDSCRHRRCSAGFCKSAAVERFLSHVGRHRSGFKTRKTSPPENVGQKPILKPARTTGFQNIGLKISRVIPSLSAAERNTHDEHAESETLKNSEICKFHANDNQCEKNNGPMDNNDDLWYPTV
jgi:hypothetical protein